MPKGKKAKEKGEEGSPGFSCRQEAGGQEGGQPSVREEAQELWHWTGHPAQKRLNALLQMAPLHQAAAAKSHPLQAAQSPSCINQFTQTLDRQTATQLLKLAHKYRPETKQEKQQRLRDRDERKTAGKGNVPTKRPPVH